MQKLLFPNTLVSSHLPRIQTTGLGLTVALIALADTLFVDQTIGLSLSVFLVAVALATLAGNHLRATPHEAALATAVLVAGLIPTIETFEWVSALFGLAAVSVFALMMTGRLRVPWAEALRRIALLVMMDFARRLRRFVRRRHRWQFDGRQSIATLFAWATPLALGTVFAALFSAANPVFLSWISLLDPRWLLMDLQPARYAFWILVALFVTPFLRVPAFGRPRVGTAYYAPAMSRIQFSDPLLLRSLLVVNLVFALQTGLDLVHLWGGATLPEGVSPAENAQKAAYILIVSVLLAAGLVLLATPDVRVRDGGGTRYLVSALIQIWLIQNVVLVLSAIFRLTDYVETFALTELRVAAFIWMGLVATGIVLIECRIALGKSCGWLIKANLIAAGFVLYGCALVDLQALTANYNVDHSRELAGTGAPLDRGYLCALGPSALPAIERFTSRQASSPGSDAETYLRSCAETFRLTLSRTCCANGTDRRMSST
jgi:hypothetical protein